MTKWLLIILLTIFQNDANAAHITGGEVIYDYLGPGSAANTRQYRITLRLFRDENCAAPCAGMPQSVTLGVYNNDNSNLFGGFQIINLDRIESLPLNPLPPCIQNAPLLNYTAGYYILVIDLPDNTGGYTVTYQTCCRVSGIANTADMVGATFTASIPGNSILNSLVSDNGPRFNTGISVVCRENRFSLDFSATDPDGDELTYSFCNAFNGGVAVNAGFDQPAGPPYQSIPYISPLFPGTAPLGPLATINPTTGIISGIAPAEGKYVVSVCVTSTRNGTLIGTHMKDFLVTVAPCDFAGAQLAPDFTNCKDSTFTFTNLNTSPLNISFFWDFGDGNSSTEENPTYTYRDTGLYTIKLVVNRGSNCADSVSKPLRVFPSFRPNFNAPSPYCKGLPVQFTDNTFATYGPVNSWTWNFGDNASGASNTSTLQNPLHTFATAGIYTVLLNSTSIKGCKDTVSKKIEIVDQPTLRLTNDTLICSIDTIQLSANAPIVGNITWSPNYNINNVNSFTPLVSPDVTTTYTASFTDAAGCRATGRVTVRVVSQVTIAAMPDTSICKTDSLLLRIISDALSFSWTPAATLNNSNIKMPTATPKAASTTYKVTGRIGKCTKDEEIVVRTVPFPIANAGADTAICFGANVQLNASGGSNYSWSPSFYLTATNIRNPIAQTPAVSLTYVVTVTDTLGCPKPVRDSIMINVTRVIADAGPRDTAVVLNQPLQLFATGGLNYQWTPSTWLNNPNINNPVSLPQDSIKYVVRVSDAQGCFSRDTINVRLFTVKPGLYVPSGFTPNGDEINNIFRPIALGIRSLDLFKVFNRWGELVFETKVLGKGWDGTYKGVLQGTSTFVWYAEATDYLGNKLKRKGSVVLIR